MRKYDTKVHPRIILVKYLLQDILQQANSPSSTNIIVDAAGAHPSYSEVPFKKSSQK
jgi:hypothetical protein